jgi:glycerol kinase
MAKLTLGTSAMLNLHVEDAKVEAPTGFYALPLWKLGTDTAAYCIEGTVITAGSSIEWLSEIGLLEKASDIDAVAGSVPDSQGIVFVPALQGLGSPYLDVGARALLLGLTRGTEPAHIARAAIEGVAHRCVDLCDNLPIGDEPLRVDGGLARSDLLLQTLSDLSGRSLLRAAEAETTALGAAMFAGLATGFWATPDQARSTAEDVSRFDPRMSEEDRKAARNRWTDAVSRTQTPI